MSRSQPTLRQARQLVEDVERYVAKAKTVQPLRAEWQGWQSKMLADGFALRYHGQRQFYYPRWPISQCHNRCTECGKPLRDSRDAGGQGFWFDARWMKGNPAVRDPRNSEPYDPRYACMPCFNRIRRFIRDATIVNENRLMIGRIQREGLRVQAQNRR